MNSPRFGGRQSLLVRRFLRPRRIGGSGLSVAFATRTSSVSGALLRCIAFFLVLGIAAPESEAELFDSLDAFPPRWQLDTSDCDARVTDHSNQSTGGVNNGGCESVTFKAGVGSEAILVYPIEPVHPIDDLVATLSVMSARAGARVGLRVRFPYVRDPQTRRPLSLVIYGASYERPGRFETLGVGSISRELRTQTAKLRLKLGSDANLNDPYIDGFAINAYSGPGLTTLLLDQVVVKGMVPFGDHGRVDVVPQSERGNTPTRAMVKRTDSVGDATLQAARPAPSRQAPSPQATSELQIPPFPSDSVIRILEHQGEPLAWVRSLGFDAVLLARPPTAELLREAIQTQVLIYCPPPSAPDPALQTLLDPVMAWYLGGGVALDNQKISQTEATLRRLRAFPQSWQRPVVIAPVEGWSGYASLADGLVCDAPLRSRGLPASEQSQLFKRVIHQTGGQVPIAIAVEASVLPQLDQMNRTIQSTLGAPLEGNFHWRGMLAQVMQCMEHSPNAVLFRSDSSLVAGSSFAQQRSMALSYINRLIATVSPWLANGLPSGTLPIAGAAYRCARVQSDSHEFLFLCSDATIGDQALAGDGKAVEILLPPEMVQRTAWRLTGFEAERIPVQATSSGARIEIVSPDIAETIVISPDASLGARLERSARRYIGKASADRWQLCREQLLQTRRDWEHAVTSGATDASMPLDLLTVAQRTLTDAEALYRAGDASGTLRLARRADAWAARAAAKLSTALIASDGVQQDPRFTSSPPIAAGLAILQAAWHPLMQSEGWSENLIASGGLDLPNVITSGGWAFGQRQLHRAHSDAAWVTRGFFSGRGAIRLSASSTTGEPLGGGYEGTVAQLSSPPVQLDERQAVRIDAMVRTIGFGSPHQGVLVYDNLGGQEMGVLVSGAAQWTPVRLYRQNTNAGDLKVMFEIIGDGEAVVDEVSVRVWNPQPLPSLPLRPLNP